MMNYRNIEFVLIAELIQANGTGCNEHTGSITAYHSFICSPHCSSLISPASQSHRTTTAYAILFIQMHPAKPCFLKQLLHSLCNTWFKTSHTAGKQQYIGTPSLSGT